MDDHDLGALLDASVPGAAASDEALSRIHRRAGQRRRRTALAGSALTVAVIIAVGISGLTSTSTAPKPGTRPVLCAPGDVTVSIDPRSYTFEQVTRWAVKAVSHAAHTCRLDAPIKATILDPGGQIVTAVRGVLTSSILPTDPGYASELLPDTPTLVAQLEWTLPCSDGPVDLEVAVISPAPSRLRLARQPCEGGSISRSRLVIYTGEMEGTCPFGSLTIAIEPQATQSDVATGWVVTVATHARHACRTNSGFKATIESPGGTVLGAISGNPAGQGSDYQGLFTPTRARRAVAALCISLGWTTDEAASVLGIAPSTARVQLHRARDDLHRALGEPSD